MEIEKDIMNIDTIGMKKPDFEVTLLLDGIGIGSGNISHNDRIDVVAAEKIKLVVDAISTGEILVPVDNYKDGTMLDDDGCGDGRVTLKVYQDQTIKKRSLNRAKVFGGGPTMAAASRIGLGKHDKKPLQEVFADSVSALKTAKIDFGGHTDNHSSEDKSGCGAIDNAPLIIQNIASNSEHIKATIQGLGIDTTGLDDAMANFQEYAELDLVRDSKYSGSAVMDTIIDSGKIVKELDGTHNEMFIILNMLKDQTVDQEIIRSLSGGEIQAFVVDVWRLASISDRLYSNKSDIYKNNAFLSKLIYTLGVAATLTKGDLPVYIIGPPTS